MTVDAVTARLRACRFAYADERRLQEGIAAALQAAGYGVEREVKLDARSRIDLLCGRVGIEVKVSGGTETVARQIARYLASSRLDGVVLVTNRVRHVDLASDDGKVAVVLLAEAL